MFGKPTLQGWTQEGPGILKPTPTRADAKVKALTDENEALKATLDALVERVKKLEGGQ